MFSHMFRLFCQSIQFKDFLSTISMLCEEFHPKSAVVDILEADVNSRGVPQHILNFVAFTRSTKLKSKLHINYAIST